MIKESIKKVIAGADLSKHEMENAMTEILDGKATPAQVGCLVTALRMKGETVDEITGAAKAIQTKLQKFQLNNHVINLDRDDINLEDETILTTSETQKAGTNTFNVSTATIFVVAGGGLRVVRQGNWAKSRYFGAADVLQHLGVKLDISRTDVERCIQEVGIGFLFAPLFHGIMRHVNGMRGEMGIRSIFNLIGPLANPAGASAHVLGVYEEALTEKMARVLNNLGAREAFVVCGEGTFDEISICGSTRMSHLKNGNVESYTMEPEDFGFPRATAESLRGGDVRKNAQIIHEILSGQSGPKRDMVILNAAAAFVVAGLDHDLKDGITRAAEVIDSGKAKEKLDALVRFTSKCGLFARE